MVYEPAMHAAALRRLRQADELRAAMSGTSSPPLPTDHRAGDRAGHRRGGAAALAAPDRWAAPADTFIPVAEETGLIVALDGWVLDSAVAQVAAWRASGRARRR